MFVKSDTDCSVFRLKPALLTAKNTCSSMKLPDSSFDGGAGQYLIFLNWTNVFWNSVILKLLFTDTTNTGLRLWQLKKHFSVSNLEEKFWKLRGKLRVSLGRLFSDKMLFVENGDWPVLHCVPVCLCVCVCSCIFLTLCGRLPAVLLFCHPVVLLFSAWNRMWFRLHGSLCNWMD